MRKEEGGKEYDWIAPIPINPPGNEPEFSDR
jgi:hypothetical protein